jgi:hypothetical protein
MAGTFASLDYLHKKSIFITIIKDFLNLLNIA